MKTVPLDLLARLRILVGFLGERDQDAWWSSAFFGASSDAFLAPVFGRTAWLARYHGVCRAAGLVHDERIGVGQVVHLFRLPEALEQALHQEIGQPAIAGTLQAQLAGRDAALQALRALAGAAGAEGSGPVRIGALADVPQPRAWRQVAAQYAAAFADAQDVYPYFADR
jgi:hypothetical protein